MKGAVKAMARKMTTILGTKVSVISWTWVNAWKSAITMPTAIAAATAGPDAMMTVHSAAWTRSSASASFIRTSASRHDDAGAKRHLGAVLENRNRTCGGDGKRLDHSRRLAVARRHRVADQAFGLREGR